MYNHDEIIVKVMVHNKPAERDIPWPMKEIPQMGDLVRFKGRLYRVKFREFVIPRSQDDRHSIIAWVE